jgi:ribonuclease R
VARYATLYLADRIGAAFAGRISGVTRAGLFITLDETGADGLVPMRRLGGDYFVHEEAQHRLVGRRSGRRFTLGDPVRVKLLEANAVTGSLLFELETDDTREIKTKDVGGRGFNAGRVRRSVGYSKSRRQGI